MYEAEIKWGRGLGGGTLQEGIGINKILTHKRYGNEIKGCYGIVGRQCECTKPRLNGKEV